MAHITIYGDDFNEKLKSPESSVPDLNKIAKRVGPMADSGGGITQIDLERYIGENDLLRFNYLSRGVQAGQSVCRIYVADVFGGGGSWGTGFLITPGLIITNNHVIPDEGSAQRAFAEFGYEADNNGIIAQGKRFKLLPEKGFITSLPEELDMTIVAIATASEDGTTAIDEYGFLRLSPNTEKIDDMEFVSIIEHPNGNEKYISIRENQVVKIGDNDPLMATRIWYKSDTAPGASGAPAFNDQWQVVALHHSGVADSKTNPDGSVEIKLKNGSWIPRDQEAEFEGAVNYIANEGIRISKITEFVKDYVNDPKNQQNNLGLIREFLDDAYNVKPITVINTKASIVPPTMAPAALVSVSGTGLEAFKTPSKNIWPVSHYAGRKGYDENFLGINIPFPTITDDALKFGPVTPVTGGADGLLRYTHFSLVHNTERKIAFVTAVNINGKTWTNIKRGTDKWYYDSRIPLDVQLGDEMYSNEPSSLGTKGWFDRGHLVRRQDPDWGTMQEAGQADEDTFHWANCSPQYWGFNQGQQLWQGLENYILDNTNQEDILACVFTGPIFNHDDETHRGVQIPQFFFKVIAVTDSNNKLYASAYVVSQQKWAQNIPFEILPVGDFNHFQTSISKIEAQTGLGFAAILKQNDVLGGGNDIGLKSLADIKHPRRS